MKSLFNMTLSSNLKQLLDAGKKAYQRGEYFEAAQAFSAASRICTSQGNPVLAAELANDGSVAFLMAGKPQEAFSLVDGTPEVFKTKGDQKRMGIALGNLGEALHSYQQSAECLSETGDDQLRLYALQSLSALQLRMGMRLQAIATMQAGLEGIEKPNPQQALARRLLRIPFELLNKP